MKIKPAHALNSNGKQLTIDMDSLAPSRVDYEKTDKNKVTKTYSNNEGGTVFAYSNSKTIQNDRTNANMARFAGIIPNNNPVVISQLVEEDKGIAAKNEKGEIIKDDKGKVINETRTRVYNGEVTTVDTPMPGLRDTNIFRGKTTPRESVDEDLKNYAIDEENKSDIRSRLFNETSKGTENLDSAFGADLGHRYSDLSQIDRQAFAQKKSNIDAANTSWEKDGNTQDINDEDKSFKQAAGETLGKVGKSLGVSRKTINNVTGLASDISQLLGGEGATQKEFTNSLSTSMVALESWKSKRFKSFHTNNWKDRVNLNSDANVANSMMSDLRGELGKTTGGIGGAVGNSNPLGQAAGTVGDMLLGGASNTNAVMNIAGDITGKDIADSAWNTQIDELAVLNTTTKDTMYISKPGTRFKAKSGMVQNITKEGQAIFGTSRYIKNGDSYRNTYGTVIDSLRDNQISASRLSNIRRYILNTNNSFSKKQAVYDLKKDQTQGALYNLSASGDERYVWNISDELFSGFNLSTEERQLVTLLKNKNTFNKTLGYIYIRPYYNYNTGEKQTSNNGLGLFDIPFEFSPRILEGAMQANYQSETLLGRLGQFHIYTGTNLSTLSIELEYLALAPDNIDDEDERTMNKQYGTDAWQYYWTNNRIEAIEMKLRSLVVADYVSDNYLIKPPLIEVHLDNSDGMMHTVGDLYKYPAAPGTNQENVGVNYLKYSASLEGKTLGSRYKKYIVNSVQIDRLNDADVEYPSLYGRQYNSNYSDKYNPMWHLTNGESGKGYKGYSRKRGFKASLQLTEVVENFLDLVPDFKAYFDAWSAKEEAADNVSGYAEGTLGVDKTSILKNTVEQTLKEAENMATTTLTTVQDRIDARFDEYEKLSKLYAKSYSEITDKKGAKTKRFYIGQFNELSGKFAFIEHSGEDNENITRDNSSSAAGENIENKNIKKSFGTLLTIGIKQQDNKNFKNGYTWNTMVNYSKDGEHVESINSLKTYTCFNNSEEHNFDPKLLYKKGEQNLLTKDFISAYTDPNFNYFGFQNTNEDSNYTGYFVNKNNLKKIITKYDYIDAYTNLEAVGKISETVQWLDEAAKETNERMEQFNSNITYSFDNSAKNASDPREYDPFEIFMKQKGIAIDFVDAIEEAICSNNIKIAGKKISEIDLSDYQNGIIKVPSKMKAFVSAYEILKNKNFSSYDEVYNTLKSIIADKDKISEFLNGSDEFTITTEYGTKEIEDIISSWTNINTRFKHFGLTIDSKRADIKAVAEPYKEKLIEYLENFDLTKAFAKVHLRAMRNNQLALLGAFNTNKIVGISADKKKAKPQEFPSDKQDINSVEDYLKEDSGAAASIIKFDTPTAFANSTKVEDCFTFKTYQLDMTLITLKDFILALADGFEKAKEALSNLVSENKDLIGGLDISSLTAVDIESAVETYMTALRTATKNFKKNQDGELIFSEDGELEEKDKSDPKQFLDNISATLKKSYNAMETAVVLCDSVFGRKHIEEQLDNLYIEGKDGKINAVEKYKLSVFKNYGAGNTEESSAKKKNGDEYYLSCYKDKSGEYLLKKVEFENRTDYEEADASEDSGSVSHGLIYRLYAQKQTMNAQASKINRAKNGFHTNLMG